MLGEEALLPRDPAPHAPFDLIRNPPWHRGEDLRAGVVGGLEQAWHDTETVVADRGRFRFQPHVPGVRHSKGLPPGALLAFDGEFHQVLPLLFVDLIQVAQLANVPRAGAALARLKSAHLGRTDHEALGDLLGCPALTDPECPQQGPKLAAADCWAATCGRHSSHAPLYGR